MASGDPSMFSQAQTAVLRHSTELEAAEQLLQHSHGRRSDGFGTTNVASDRSPPAHFAAPPPFSEMDDGARTESTFEAGQDSDRLGSYERNSDVQYPPINHSPAMGQVCR